MDRTITRDSDSEEWSRLYKLWNDGKEAGVVAMGGRQWRVLRPSDGVVNFLPMGGVDEMYGSTTTI